MRSPGTTARRAAAILLLGVGLACSEARDPSPAVRTAASGPLEEGPLVVRVVNEPLATLARKIGGEHVDVALPAPLGVDPAYWRPGPEIVAEYQAADLIIENGAGYAAWTAQATLPRTRRVDTSAAFRDRLIRQTGASTHAHGPGGEHSHADTAFTTWLDPALATLQAQAITEALARRRPAAEPDFRAAMAALEAELAALDRHLARGLAPLGDEPVLFSHPVYAYFARRYGLTGDSLHWEPGQMPPASEWRALEARLAESPVRFLLLEGPPHPDAEARLRALGVETIVVAPGGPRTESGDWLALMRDNADRIEARLAPVGG